MTTGVAFSVQKSMLGTTDGWTSGNIAPASPANSAAMV